MFRKPSTKKLGLKVLVLGEKGVGKSVFSLSFPRVYAIDGETGMAFYESHPRFGQNLLGIVNTQDFNELQEAIDELMDMGVEEVGTLSIDSETKIYENLTDASLQVEEKKARKNGKDVNDSSVSMRGWGRIKAIATRLQNLKIDLSAKGINVISIAQIDDVKQKVGENFVKVGEKPVMKKNSEYDYDIVIKLFTETDAKGDAIYKGIILKDRTGVTKVNQVVENPSYDTWRLFLEARDGADTIKSNLAQDNAKSQKALEEEDAEAEKTIVDKLKEAMAMSDAHQAKAVALIQEAGIKNPLSPTATELNKLQKIVEIVSEM
ncbi:MULTISPECIES: AAA family ATPase [Bacillus cereus group]|uniref:AAA family ATPase n=1 Tax=Bacillus cereus group TaxID=86661 RepID=UPI001D137150|nr:MULTISPECIES: AAA family ATPase [Bacillus cereus group]MCC3687452.1 ATP-binding protein [Bacillus cereus]MCM0006184.1 ATP-binding protein [Bacillus paranthracis]MDX6046703.1 AAA family ATPase [Bacillus paranthracis]